MERWTGGVHILPVSLPFAWSSVQPFPEFHEPTEPPFWFLFISLFACARCSLLPGLFSSCDERGLLSSCSAQGSHCSSISCCWAQALGRPASVAAAPGFSHCSSWALQHRLGLQCMGLVPGLGIKLVSPALAGGFFSTEPLGKPLPNAPTLPPAHFVWTRPLQYRHQACANTTAPGPGLN